MKKNKEKENVSMIGSVDIDSSVFDDTIISEIIENRKNTAAIEYLYKDFVANFTYDLSQGILFEDDTNYVSYDKVNKGSMLELLITSEKIPVVFDLFNRSKDGTIRLRPYELKMGDDGKVVLVTIEIFKRYKYAVLYREELHKNRVSVCSMRMIEGYFEPAIRSSIVKEYYDRIFWLLLNKMRADATFFERNYTEMPKVKFVLGQPVEEYVPIDQSSPKMPKVEPRSSSND